MTTDELIARGAAQPIVSKQATVSVAGPTLRALLDEGKPILLSELNAHPDQHQESRTFRYAHMLGQGLGDHEIQAWRAEHSEHPLPDDLVEFLHRVNGVHLWADMASSRAYFGIAPLNEWQDVATGDYSAYFEFFESRPAGQLVISYHQNGDYILILDTHKREYRWHDLEDFDNPKHAGVTVSELLEFWWRETAWLDPRRTNGATEAVDKNGNDTWV